MEALVPAFIAALLATLGDRPPRLAAMLAERHGVAIVMLAAVLALAAGNAVAGFVAMEIAPRLTPNGQGLLVAVALLFAAGSGLFPAGKLPDGCPRLGGFLGSLVVILSASGGDRSQFIAFALGSADGDAWFAAAGSAAGAGAVVFVAAVLGDSAWSRLPLRVIRIATAFLFLVAGAVTGLSALRLA
ncbi:TMEM165/GDT1 family protein [Sphingomonas sp.]|uniref:TMEM165/GDT1 family protein n=1 Tax=Sphingomonas sp. TaxID=28214 RepID=UPI001B2614F3|nr:TMEM165/GDT1 family protein [Sphingomonas sp.]MBO9714111.1 TMEM165/GDT1 family protein [Sphingomonas sp.]